MGSLCRRRRRLGERVASTRATGMGPMNLRASSGPCFVYMRVVSRDWSVSRGGGRDCGRAIAMRTRDHEKSFLTSSAVSKTMYPEVCRPAPIVRSLFVRARQQERAWLVLGLGSSTSDNDRTTHTFSAIKQSSPHHRECIYSMLDAIYVNVIGSFIPTSRRSSERSPIYSIPYCS
jgi:hypothetical protein